MARKRRNEKIACQFFTWLLSRRRGVFQADGRSNAVSAGRHSLNTRSYAEATQRLRQLDQNVAIERGLVQASDRPQPTGTPPTLPLSEGRDLYLAHAGRSRVVGGVRPSSLKRYRAALANFLAFAAERGLEDWGQINAAVLQEYACHLERNRRAAYRTQFLEITTVKQVVGWLIRAGRLPQGCRIDLPLRKPQGSRTYCWRPEEVRAMVDYCRAKPELNWLGNVLVALAFTGLRIAELSGLRWSNIDMASGMIHLPDNTSTARPGDALQTTKSGRDRSFPIHAKLRDVLRELPQTAAGFVFFGPRGGRLKPDTVRTILVKDVLRPLAPKFPTRAGERGFASGRLHGFRHTFVSSCARCGVPEATVMRWLGHAESRMVKHYFHLFDDEARRQMRRLHLFELDAGDNGAAGNEQ